MVSVPSRLDHLVYATPDLAATVADLEHRLGVRPFPGGAHPDWGTRNAVLPLSPTAYLEIIGPDPERAGPAPRLFGIDALRGPRLVTWAARETGLADLAARARADGVELGAVTEGSRLRPDGTRLTWMLTDPFAPRCGGVVPFFIDWRDGPHPAEVAPAEVALVSLSAGHPDADPVRARLVQLEIDLDVTPAAAAFLEAGLGTSRGIVRLR